MQVSLPTNHNTMLHPVSFAIGTLEIELYANVQLHHMPKT
jgi:hypothetical protein